ncbi:MAG: HEAT repeat domain-containing protein [Alphaproteobacteria bacterium]|nr:HEAT repeat domain-containing protein [Alphaproteobacteria bacterium]
MRPRYADLFRRMRDPDPIKQDAAFDAVLFDRADALPDVVECYLSTDDDSLIRYFMVQLMAFSGSKKAVKPLIQALEDPDPMVRAEACRGLEDLRPRSASRALRARLTDMDPEVREAAADAITALKR